MHTMYTLPLDTLVAMRAHWQQQHQRVVLTNGIFDLLHSGHVRYLEQARAMGEVLIVGINSDTSTRALKGATRPLVPENERAYMLAALRCVDYVTIFTETTAEHLVAAIMPDVYVKGGDYALAPSGDDGDNITPSAIAIDETRLPEAHVARRYGARVVLVPYATGFSTTTLIQRIVAGAIRHQNNRET